MKDGVVAAFPFPIIFLGGIQGSLQNCHHTNMLHVTTTSTYDGQACGSCGGL